MCYHNLINTKFPGYLFWTKARLSGCGPQRQCNYNGEATAVIQDLTALTESENEDTIPTVLF